MSKEDEQDADEYTDACNEKRRGTRLGAIRSVLRRIDDAHKDHDVVGEPDPRVVRPARAVAIGG